jgi:phospholipid/cholesterol/gamma-HCH transport system permease protein
MESRLHESGLRLAWAAWRARVAAAWAMWRFAGQLTGWVLLWAVSPATYRGPRWHALARELVAAVQPALVWYTAVWTLLAQVLIHIVVVTAQAYGLQPYAVEMIVRVLVLELIPLSAALFVLLRVMLRVVAAWSPGSAGAAPPLAGPWAPWQALVPRALAGALAVLLLVLLSSWVALILAYLNLYGWTPWAWSAFTQAVGQIFDPAVSLVFVLKTLFFALAVAVMPLLPTRRAGGGWEQVDALVRTTGVLLLLELLALLGNYY